jgi:hypothetical protein
MKSLSVVMRRSTIIQEDRIDIARREDGEILVIVIHHGARISCTPIDQGAALKLACNLLALSGAFDALLFPPAPGDQP